MGAQDAAPEVAPSGSGSNIGGDAADHTATGEISHATFGSLFSGVVP
jgi:hypothetical protein